VSMIDLGISFVRRSFRRGKGTKRSPAEPGPDPHRVLKPIRSSLLSLSLPIALCTLIRRRFSRPSKFSCRESPRMERRTRHRDLISSLTLPPFGHVMDCGGSIDSSKPASEVIVRYTRAVMARDRRLPISPPSFDPSIIINVNIP